MARPRNSIPSNHLNNSSVNVYADFHDPRHGSASRSERACNIIVTSDPPGLQLRDGASAGPTIPIKCGRLIVDTQNDKTR